MFATAEGGFSLSENLPTVSQRGSSLLARSSRMRDVPWPQPEGETQVSRIANELKLALDPVEFFRAATVDEKHPQGFEPDDWQKLVLETDAKKVAINCSRQSGKTTVVSSLALWTATYDYPGETVVLVAPSLRQSSEAMNSVANMYRKLSGESVEPIVAESALRLKFRNHSRIVALPGSGDATVRGLNAQLVIVDEAARVSDELMNAVRPFLATKKDGRLITLSTPWWSRGWWYEAWKKNDPDWLKVKADAYSCSRIDKVWLESERSEIGEINFKSEYCCEFLNSSNALFSDALIEAAFDNDLRPLWS
jgi:hypothetical protein